MSLQERLDYIDAITEAFLPQVRGVKANYLVRKHAEEAKAKARAEYAPAPSPRPLYMRGGW